MKRLYLYVFPLLFVIACSGTDDHPDAKQILEQVSRQYQNLETYEFKVRFTSELTAGDKSRKQELPIHYMQDRDGKMRLEIRDARRGMILVSNGDSTWTYLAGDNQYTVKDAAEVNLKRGSADSRKEAQLQQMARRLTSQYTTINQQSTSAKFLREDRYGLHDDTVDVYVIEVTYEPKVQQPNTRLSPTTYWIDQDRMLVLRQTQTVHMDTDRVKGGTATMEQRIRMQSVRLNTTFNPIYFTFKPPSTAERVDQLDDQAVEQAAPGAVR